MRHTTVPRKFRKPISPFWYAQLEWTGNKTQVLPLIEHIVGKISDHSGVWMSGPESGLCDAAWDCDSEQAGFAIYGRLLAMCKAVRRFAPYFRLRLIYCDPQQAAAPRKWKPLAQYRRGKFVAMKIRTLRKRPRRKAA